MEPQGTEWPFFQKKLLIKSKLVEATVREKTIIQTGELGGCGSSSGNGVLA